MVAIELAASCSPLRKSKMSAVAISAIRIGRLMTSMARRSKMIGDDGIDLVRDVLEAVDHLFQAVVELRADDEIHGAEIAAVAGAPIEIAAALVIELVGLLLDPDHLSGELVQPRRVGADGAQQRHRLLGQIGG